MRYWASAWGLLLLLLAMEAHGAAEILDLRHWSAPDHTRIVLDLSEPPSYEAGSSPTSRILAWWMESTSPPRKEMTVPIQDGIVKRVSLERFSSHQVRLIINLAQDAQVRVFPLKKFADKPDRLVFDLLRPDLEILEKEKRQKARNWKEKRNRIVVIDPGHGGEDPGAVGLKGAYEKDIVLALGKKLKQALDREKNIRAYLTRQGDYFVSLAGRLRIAREYGADLFVSLHCNGSRKKYLQGTSVYCLSARGASDVAARRLAQIENASD